MKNWKEPCRSRNAFVDAYAGLHTPWFCFRQVLVSLFGTKNEQLGVKGGSVEFGHSKRPALVGAMPGVGERNAA